VQCPLTYESTVSSGQPALSFPGIGQLLKYTPIGGKWSSSIGDEIADMQ